MNRTDKIVGDFFYMNIGTFCRDIAVTFEEEVAGYFRKSTKCAEPSSLYHPYL
jgi:hypothetical protein